MEHFHNKTFKSDAMNTLDIHIKKRKDCETFGFTEVSPTTAINSFNQFNRLDNAPNEDDFDLNSTSTLPPISTNQHSLTAATTSSAAAAKPSSATAARWTRMSISSDGSSQAYTSRSATPRSTPGSSSSESTPSPTPPGSTRVSVSPSSRTILESAVASRKVVLDPSSRSLLDPSSRHLLDPSSRIKVQDNSNRLQNTLDNRSGGPRQRSCSFSQTRPGEAQEKERGRRKLSNFSFRIRSTSVSSFSSSSSQDSGLSSEQFWNQYKRQSNPSIITRLVCRALQRRSSNVGKHNTVVEANMRPRLMSNLIENCDN